MKKNLIFVIILLMVGALAACSTQSAQGGAPAGAPAAGGAAPAGGPNGTGSSTGQSSGTATSAKIAIESKVGIGILKLEGTDQAVDAAKAQELLPLFKALKTLSTNNNTAVAEITALNTQIKNTMTADQLSAIENMNITTSELRTLLETYGVTSSASSSSSSSSSSQGGMGGPGGPDGAMMAVMSGASTTSSKTQATPNAAAAMTTSRKTAGGYNLTLVDPIIKLLQSKITK